MQNTTRNLARSLWLAAIIICACACGAPTGSGAPQRTVATMLRVGFIPVADSSQLFVALNKGYFTSRNVTLDTTSMAGGAPILEALGAGSLDVGFSNIVSLILAHDAGLPLVAITGGPVEDREHKEHGILVAPGSSITKIEDLSGATIALNTRKNIDELMVIRLLKQHGVDPASVKFVEVPFPRMLSALLKGDVAAVAAIEPFVTVGISTGAGRVLSYNYVEVQEVTPISTFVVTRDWLTKNSAAAGNFSAAIAEATRLANHNPAVVREALAQYTHLDLKYLQHIVLPTFSERLSTDQLKALIQSVRDIGWISKTFDPSEIIAEKSGA